MGDDKLAWIYLVIGGLMEVIFTVCLKYSENFSKFWPSFWFFVSSILSFILLNKAINLGIPIGTAYAVWTGIGAALTVIAGIILFKEPAELPRLIFLMLLIGSIIGLKFVTKG